MESVKGNNDTYLFEEKDIIRKKGRVNTILTGFAKSLKQKVVIKRFPLKNKTQKEIIEHEAKLNIDNLYLAKTIDFFVTDDEIFLIREYVQGIDLKEFISYRKYYRKVDFKFYIRCMIKTLNAIEALHNRGIIHGDIKPANIILKFSENGFSTENPEIKLIDFGLSYLKGYNYESQKVRPFALIYSPPEVLLNIHELINETSDIFSAGITLYELITRKPPIDSDNPLKLIALQMVYPLPVSSKIPKEIFEILKKATYKYPLERPPHTYSLEKLKTLLIEAQQKRFQSAAEMRESLQNALTLL
ncbi:MAG: hypothetical protein Kow0068_21990 [Marinilabiliales bacterium]